MLGGTATGSSGGAGGKGVVRDRIDYSHSHSLSLSLTLSLSLSLSLSSSPQTGLRPRVPGSGRFAGGPPEALVGWVPAASRPPPGTPTQASKANWPKRTPGKEAWVSGGRVGEGGRDGSVWVIK